MKAREKAQGKWRSVLSSLGVPEKYLDGQHHPCPASGEGEDRFRFADRNGSGNFFCGCSQGEKGGMALVMCCKGVQYAEAARLVEGVVGGCQTAPDRERADPKLALNRVRRKLRPAGASITTYLHGRGLDVPPTLRETRLTYWHAGESLGEYDVMVGRVDGPDGAPQTYHLTYLAGGKKAPVPSPRKAMTPVKTIMGGAIRLYPEAPEMGVAEGIETAIAASMLFRMPVWAAVNAGSLSEFQPPAVCEHLTVFGDSDKSYTGQWAAYSLARRIVRNGKECAVLLPESGDWNDVLNRQQAKAAA